MILKNAEVPIAISKMFNVISNIKNEINLPNYQTGRIGQSYNYYWFPIRHKKLEFAFGYFLPLWAKYKTPIFIQFREIWAAEKSEDIIKILYRQGFVYEMGEEYVLPCPFNTNEELVKFLLDFLRLIDDGLKDNA